MHPEGAAVTVLLVHGAYTAAATRGLLPTLKAPVLVFEVDDHAPAELITSDARTCTYESYLTEADYEGIDQFVLNFMQRGFIVEEDDLTEWNGVSLGAALVAEELLLLPNIIRNALCARRIFERTIEVHNITNCL